MAGYTIVFFDLETTGLNTQVCDIIQLSAICGDNIFEKFTVPSQPIDKGATNVTGFTVHEGNLLRNGVWIQTIPLCDVLTSFLDYLCSFQRPILLVAHNARCFDVPVLTRVLRKHGLLGQFQHMVSMFLDTLRLSKALFPESGSHSLKNLVRNFLGKTYDAHNATEDARMLQELFYRWNLSEREMSGFMYPSSQE